ncbi:WD40 repeat-like protein [Microstroma glucosiphilum]|uniref:WD40 repeat-like protein n=1 Tax=Pseudomicrostroma glucosiphilum TaxID=1684307 RepID=A0A316U4P0_9BASI|nr:WD40 repeat-like protein [Pseudomicrostroma glucosiphilum]PWN20216.1 WD40 repeat-like protein [Pseudomicrostroma glucosiphilum]
MDIIGDHLSSLSLLDDAGNASTAQGQQVDQSHTLTHDYTRSAAQDLPKPRERRASPLMDMAEAVVLKYLTEHWVNSDTLAAFERELSITGGAAAAAAAAAAGGKAATPDLLDLLRPRIAAAANASSLISGSTLSFPALPGPSKLPYRVSLTHSSLHPSNILLLRSLSLPVRRFNTSPADGSDPRFEVRYQPCLASSGADKRLLFFDADEGEVLESVEPVARTEQSGHTAPVLDLAQHPLQQRELVTAGMDGKVVVWDLLTLRDGPILVLKDHTKFVVRCCWSSEGRWLATAGYDKKVHIYERVGEEKTSSKACGAGDAMDEDEEEEDDLELQPLRTRLRLVRTISTRGNPEALAFVPTPAGEQLVYSIRDDCFIHYLSLPNSTGSTSSSSSSAWQEDSFNTNEHTSDTHVSYSILSIVPHPTLPLLSLLTGSHASISSNSLVILMPPLSSSRALVLHTTLPSSPTYSPRQAWRADGAGVWLSSEEGQLRLFDLSGGEAEGGRERSALGVHGALSEVELSGMSAEEKAKRWRMGGANGCIKDVIVLPDGRIASCGFDRTVRIVDLEQSAL